MLPNYAFPEVGVMLNSLIYRKKTESTSRARVPTRPGIIEYERPAVSAIEELAPANTFYAEGRRVKIDQVDMSVSEVETWRFCNICSHKELLGKEAGKKGLYQSAAVPMWARYRPKTVDACACVRSLHQRLTGKAA